MAHLPYRRRGGASGGMGGAHGDARRRAACHAAERRRGEALGHGRAAAALQRALRRCQPRAASVHPPAHARELDPEAALVEVIRGRLTGSGPLTVASLASLTGIAAARIESALAALQAEGFAMQGLFTPQASPGALEWCERRLLARIHRYTVKRLRAEIEPIQARDFLRFLFEWQRVAATSRMEGPDAVGAILAQLEGFEAAAGAWETEILPERISEYEPAWLDEQCLAGRFLWTRLSPRRSDPERRAAPVRATPIVLLARRNHRLWSAL